MMRLRPQILTLAACAVLAVACGDGSTGPITRPPVPSLEETLRSYRNANGLPAIAAAIIRSDSIEEVAAVGVRRLSTTDSVTVDDEFHIGSDTKAMVATVAGTLVEDGVLEWFHTPVHIFPDLADTIHTDLQSITLRDLLTHRAGLQPFTTGAEWNSVPAFPGTPVEQRRAFVAWFLSRPPWGTVGQYEYSNAGYSIAAAMLEEITQRAWNELLQERLFTPLGMTTAGFGWPAFNDPNQPWGHWVVSGSLEPHPPDDAYQLGEFIGPAGDVHVSITDFARFVQMHLRGFRGQDGILKSETVQYLHDPVGSYALGWGVYSTGGHSISSHNGSAGTFYATMAFSRSRDWGVVIATNAGGSNAQSVCSTLLSVFLNRYSND
jgi:CubicO group peptidase (beta-lactamase class C family)